MKFFGSWDEKIKSSSEKIYHKHRTFAITTQSVSIDVLFQNKEKDKEVSLMQIRDSSRQN